MEFRKIANYENYLVNTCGNVRNDFTNKVLKPVIEGNEYYIVNLYKYGKMKTIKIHRLVAVAFIENPDDKPCIDHINNYYFTI